MGVFNLPGSNSFMFQNTNNKDINPFPERNEPGNSNGGADSSQLEFHMKQPASAKSILAVIDTHKDLEQQKYDNEKPIPQPDDDDENGPIDVRRLEDQRKGEAVPEESQESSPVPKNIIRDPANRANNEQAFKDYVLNQERILKSASNVLSIANEVEQAKIDLGLGAKKDIIDPARFSFESPLNKGEKLKPYDRTKGTPSDPEILKKRDFVKEMTKHAWDGYEKYAWAYNELRPVTKKGHSQSIFGDAKTGATIIDAMDTLYIMGFEEEFDRAKTWLRDEFNFNSKKDVSVFETNIRFIGGLTSLFYLTGDEMFSQKAADIAKVLLPAFNTKTSLPYALYNPSTGKMKNYNWANAGCSILSEVGTLHLEFGSLTHMTHDNQFLDKVLNIRDYLEKMTRPDNRIWYNFINPNTGAWGSSKAASVGALGDSFYEYLIKTYLITDKTDTVALEMYEDALVGIKNEILRQGPEGHWYLGEYKRTRLEPKIGWGEVYSCFI